MNLCFCLPSISKRKLQEKFDKSKTELVQQEFSCFLDRTGTIFENSGMIWTDLDRSYNQEYGSNIENIWKYQEIFWLKIVKTIYIKSIFLPIWNNIKTKSNLSVNEANLGLVLGCIRMDNGLNDFQFGVRVSIN